MSPRRLPRRTPRGVSLVEACVCLAVASTAAGVALPQLQMLREHRQLEGAAALFETDFHYARSLATLHGRSIQLRFRNDAAGGCYVVHTGSARGCDCDAEGRATCSGDAEVMRLVAFPAGHAPAIRSSSATMLIDAVRGTVTPTTTLRFTGRSGAAVHQVVSLMGRVRTCSPGRVVPGHPDC